MQPSVTIPESPMKNGYHDATPWPSEKAVTNVEPVPKSIKMQRSVIAIGRWGFMLEYSSSPNAKLSHGPANHLKP